MPSYIVRWEIEVDADTPHEAIEQAIEMLPIMSSDSRATIFDVLDPDDESLIKQIDIAKDWR